MSGLVTLAFDRPPSALRYMLGAIARPARRVEGAPPIVARWTGHRPHPRALHGFLRLTGLPPGDLLPLLYPHTFGFRLSMAVLTHPAFPVPIWNVLQTRNQLVQHRGLAPDARLDFETHFRGARVVAKGLELDLHTTVRVAGALSWESLVTFLARGRYGAPAASGPAPTPPADTGPLVARWTMTGGGYLRFGGFTGDYNGIHGSDWYARRFGFRRALVHPALVLGQCLARLPAPEPGAPWRLDAWLKGPVPRGATVELHARGGADAGETTFALFADPERPSIVGRWRPVAAGQEASTWTEQNSTA